MVLIRIFIAPLAITAARNARQRTTRYCTWLISAPKISMRSEVAPIASLMIRLGSSSEA